MKPYYESDGDATGWDWLKQVAIMAGICLARGGLFIDGWFFLWLILVGAVVEVAHGAISEEA